MSDHTAHAIQTESCQVTKLTPELADMIPGVNYVEGSSQTVRVCGPGITSGPEIPRRGGPGPVMPDGPIPPVPGPVVSSQTPIPLSFPCKERGFAHLQLDGKDGDVFVLAPGLNCSGNSKMPVLKLSGNKSLKRATIQFSSQIKTLSGDVDLRTDSNSSFTDFSVQNTSMDRPFHISDEHGVKIKLLNLIVSELYIYAYMSDVTLDNVTNNEVHKWLTNINELEAQNVHFKNTRFLLPSHHDSLFDKDVQVKGLISFEEKITIHPGDSNNQSALFNNSYGHMHFSVQQVPNVHPSMFFGRHFEPADYKFVFNQSKDFSGNDGDLCVWLNKVNRPDLYYKITTNATTTDGKPCVVPEYSTTGGSVAVSVFAVCGVVLGVCAALVMAVVGDHRRGRKTSTEKAI